MIGVFDDKASSVPVPHKDVVHEPSAVGTDHDVRLCARRKFGYKIRRNGVKEIYKKKNIHRKSKGQFHIGDFPDIIYNGAIYFLRLRDAKNDLTTRYLL